MNLVFINKHLIFHTSDKKNNIFNKEILFNLFLKVVHSYIYLPTFDALLALFSKIKKSR